MKRILLSALIILTVISGVAQATSNLIIFASDPTPFYAIVNGIKQNAEPQTNVKITGLSNNQNNVKVVFADGVAADIDKNFYFESMNVEVTARIVSTKKGYKLRYFGEVAMGQAATNEQQVQIVYHTVEAAPVNNVVIDETVTTTTTITNSVNNSDLSAADLSAMEINTLQNSMGANISMSDNIDEMQENVNMNVSVGGLELNMNVNVNGVNNNMGMDMDITDNMETSHTSTTTTTTTTTSTSGANTGTQVQAAPVVYVSGYNGATGCVPPLSDVNAIRNAIEEESFSDNRLMVAKQALKGKCMSVQNIIYISESFDFEDGKLEFAKFAYNCTYDIDNFYQVNKIFSFSSSKEELNEYISNR
jgi:hypothetical protein